MSYQTVLDILRGPDYDWPLDCAPAPQATERELETRRIDQVTEGLDSWVNRRADELRGSHHVDSFATARRLVLHAHFAVGMKYWELETQKAFGYVVDPPVDKIAEARSVSEWLKNQSLGRSRHGTLLVDDTPEGNAEMARRKAKAADVPLEWATEGKGLIWSLAVIEGLIPTTIDALSAAYAQSTPSLASVRFLSPQQWLDNLRAADERAPRPWGDDGKPSVEF